MNRTTGKTTMAMRDDVAEILGEGGLLSRALTRYEHRPQQIEMARAVADAITRRRPLVVEAATGTGKSLAYLVPALLSGKRVVISTGTKALQEQLFHKDIPFLAERWPSDFSAMLLKGRTNYLCKLRLEEMKLNPRFRGREEAQLWPKILQWSNRTETGDRAEIEGMPDDFATWGELSTGAEGCLGTKCQFYEECHVTRARQKAQEADVIVVNHHLFFADMAVKESGFGEILPEFDVLIFDEAHHLESVATSYFGMQVSNWRIKELIGDVEATLEKEQVDEERIDEAIAGLDKAAREFFPLITFGLYDGRYELKEVLDNVGGSLGETALPAFIEALKDLRGAIAGTAKLGEIGERLADRCSEVCFELEHIMRADDPRYVYFVEVRDRGQFLQSAPIDLGGVLRKKLHEKHDTIVFTSATLATGETFDFFKQRIGLSGFDVDELILAPVFDYEHQSLLYVPNRLPEPRHPDYVDNVATIVDYLLGIVEGRAFVLFTSYTNLHAVYDLVAPDLPYTVLKQGEAPKTELLRRFREDTHSVLFATSSFWEGVDVEGEALSLVIIDKLPFANPSDPLTKARLDLIESTGGNSFAQFSLPSAALTLKQGFGRLIRSRDDVGVVAILDSRIAKKSYGRYFLQSLPPAPVVWRAAEVKHWWRAKQDQS